MLNALKQRLYQYYISRKKSVRFLSHVTINRGVFFEGQNAIYNNTEVRNSYIGLGTYIANNCIIRYAKIGRFCAIGDNMRTGLGMHPTDGFVSIHPAFFSLQKQAGFTFVKDQLFDEHKFSSSSKKFYVEIGNDVWVGNNVQIMDGIIIGDGAVIATGSVVTKDVEPFSIVGGVPAKHIKYRFTEDQRMIILDDPWWEKPFDWLETNAGKFSSFEQLYSKSSSEAHKH